ncbi:Htur_1727 family rSAM-partnered candidate RiPP [Haloarcula amylovorans]|uniref:Htur_1727 family rSAM-partnered candidate RiPP n=1 Tax=Haloarcula amylovorans TaxID=2562280 RepID=UPI0010763F88|nr:Htur_1727 family rSAM-partnered candidate RiPP [Halomicroarcula amylolytica]
MPNDSPELDHEVTAPRASTAREWELFVSEDVTESPRHVGSVTAPTREAALKRAERHVGRDAAALWLCPADEVTRQTTETAALSNR